jgi:hypothetical protein
MMRGIMAAILSVWTMSGAAFANCDGEGEVTLFGCETDSEKQVILLCGVGNDENDPQRYTGLRYEYVTEKGVEFSYPPHPADASKLMFYSHWFENGLLRAHLRFRNGDDTYRLFWRGNPPSTVPDEISAPTTGVEILKGKTVVATRECMENPGWYFDTTRRSAACDLENPYGERACEADGPEVK